ncbi:MAG: type II toxin-antitoxin system HicA family toxin [Candidatus Poribacteria bacterium]|nr:type II toxin-antitoxin system HicA family toxin [Candidatus Poribacteria bacterium]
MKNNPRGDWKISHVETLAKRYGFSVKRPRGGGSHVTLRHNSGKRLSVPARRPIKPAYIRQLVQIIETVEANQT